MPALSADDLLLALRRIEVVLTLGGDMSDIADDIAAIKTATETTAADGATEATLADIKTATEAMAVDPATETTLASLKTAIDSLLAAAATESTLADVLTGVGAPDDAEPGFGGDGSVISQLKALLTALGGVATETTLGVVAERLSSSAATLLASAARTADEYSADQVTSATGAYLYLKITAITATILTPTLQILDPAGGGYVDLVTLAAAPSAIGTYLYLIAPGAAVGTTTLEDVAPIPLPRTWRLLIHPSDATAATYSVGAHLLP